MPKECAEDSTAVSGVDGSGKVNLKAAFAENQLDQDAFEVSERAGERACFIGAGCLLCTAQKKKTFLD
jgi:hypothetical protein